MASSSASTIFTSIPKKKVRNRHSRRLYAADRRYIGRIWFFRDVTEERIAERRVREALSRTRRQAKIVGWIGRSEALIRGDVEDIDARVNAFLERPIEGEWPYLWLDVYLKGYADGRKARAGSANGWRFTITGVRTRDLQSGVAPAVPMDHDERLVGRIVAVERFMADCARGSNRHNAGGWAA